MTRQMTLGLLAFGFLLASGCGKAEFEDFASPDGKFKVQFPGTPKSQDQTVSGITTKTYSVEFKDGGYMVAVADMPIPEGETEAETQVRLDGSRDGMVGNVGGKLVGESKITLQGKYPGREVQFEIPDKKILGRARVYIVDRRLYQLLVIGTKSLTDSADATKFLGSLALTP